jgi:hypothetical protein
VSIGDELMACLMSLKSASFSRILVAAQFGTSRVICG